MDADDDKASLSSTDMDVDLSDTLTQISLNRHEPETGVGISMTRVPSVSTSSSSSTSNLRLAQRKSKRDDDDDDDDAIIGRNPAAASTTPRTKRAKTAEDSVHPVRPSGLGVLPDDLVPRDPDYRSSRLMGIQKFWDVCLSYAKNPTEKTALIDATVDTTDAQIAERLGYSYDESTVFVPAFEHDFRPLISAALDPRLVAVFSHSVYKQNIANKIVIANFEHRRTRAVPFGPTTNDFVRITPIRLPVPYEVYNLPEGRDSMGLNLKTRRVGGVHDGETFSATIQAMHPGQIIDRVFSSKHTSNFPDFVAFSSRPHPCAANYLTREGGMMTLGRFLEKTTIASLRLHDAIIPLLLAWDVSTEDKSPYFFAFNPGEGIKFCIHNGDDLFNHGSTQGSNRLTVRLDGIQFTVTRASYDKNPDWDSSEMNRRLSAIMRKRNSLLSRSHQTPEDVWKYGFGGSSSTYHHNDVWQIALLASVYHFVMSVSAREVLDFNVVFFHILDRLHRWCLAQGPSSSPDIYTFLVAENLVSTFARVLLLPQDGQELSVASLFRRHTTHERLPFAALKAHVKGSALLRTPSTLGTQAVVDSELLAKSREIITQRKTAPRPRWAGPSATPVVTPSSTQPKKSRARKPDQVQAQEPEEPVPVSVEQLRHEEGIEIVVSSSDDEEEEGPAEAPVSPASSLSEGYYDDRLAWYNGPAEPVEPMEVVEPTEAPLSPASSLSEGYYQDRLDWLNGPAEPVEPVGTATTPALPQQTATQPEPTQSDTPATTAPRPGPSLSEMTSAAKDIALKRQVEENDRLRARLKKLEKELAKSKAKEEEVTRQRDYATRELAMLKARVNANNS